MQIILKAPNQGKTAEAIKAAYVAAQHNEVLIVSSEESPEVLQRRIDWFADRNTDFRNRYDIITINEKVTPEMFKDPSVYHQFGTIILDVNFAMSREPWLTVCADLEEYGFHVIATQTLIKPAKATIAANSDLFH